MSRILKYAQIENYLIDRIKSGKLKIGDQIETEEELAEQFGFSRMTVNKAMNNLVEKNYIRRTAGKGSFVEATHVAKHLEKHKSFTEDMIEIGLEPGSKLLTYKLIPASENPEIAQRIHSDEDGFIHYFERLRTGNDKPIAISYNYISSKVLPDLSIDALDNSLYGYLRSKGYTMLGNDLEIEAILPENKHKKLLDIDEGAILKTRATTSVLFDEVEYILGYFETLYNGELYTYKFNR